MMSSPVSSRNVFICPMFSLCTLACEYLHFVNGFYRVDPKLIVFFLKCLKQRYVSPILRTQPFVSFSESFSTFRRHFLPKMCSFALHFPFARLLPQIVRIVWQLLENCLRIASKFGEQFPHCAPLETPPHGFRSASEADKQSCAPSELLLQPDP